MPMYDFKCKSCGFVFDDYLRKSDDTNPTCSKCNNETNRLVSNFCGIVPNSTNRTLDCIVGADADRRWQKIHDNKGQKRKG